jgi:hypothetical protein
MNLATESILINNYLAPMKTVCNCTPGEHYDLSENTGLCSSYQLQSMLEVHTDNMTLRQQGNGYGRS